MNGFDIGTDTGHRYFSAFSSESSGVSKLILLVMCGSDAGTDADKTRFPEAESENNYKFRVKSLKKILPFLFVLSDVNWVRNCGKRFISNTTFM